MANNRNKNKDNVNQPRRKRNKKPVKRYSEEYSNRPNPYTGYSADGNYHPEAKTQNIDNISPDDELKDSNAYPTEEAEVSVVTSEAIAIDSKGETSSADESDKESEHIEKTVKPTAVKSSRRRKGAISAASKKAKQREKTEARKAVLDKIAKGVEAHSVSEKMIDDIASMSDAIESMSKIGNEEKENSQSDMWEDLYEVHAKPTKKNKPSDSENSDEPQIPKPRVLNDDEKLPFDIINESRTESIKEPEVSESTEAEKIAEVPNTAEVTEVPEEEKAEVTSTDSAGDDSNLTEETDDIADIAPLNPADLIPVLDFDKLSNPVIDFSEPNDVPADGVSETPKEEIITTASIEEILNAVEQEKLDAAQRAKEISRSDEFTFGSDMIFDTSKSEDWNEIIPPLEAPDDTENLDKEENIPAHEDNNADDSAQDISDIYAQLDINTSDEEDEYLDGGESLEDILSEIDSMQTSEDVFSTATDNLEQEISDSEGEQELNTAPAEQIEEPIEQTEKIESIEELTDRLWNDVQDETSTEQPEKSEQDYDINIAAIEDEIFTEADTSAAEDEIKETTGETKEAEEPEVVSVPGGSVEENQAAVKEKIEKLIEAAELAELLRQESEDTELTPSPSETVEELPSQEEDTAEASESAEGLVPSQDEIREYQSTIKPVEDEEVFESVLIVDDFENTIKEEDSEKQDDTLFIHSGESVEAPTAVFKLPEGPIVLPTDIDDGDFQEQWLDEDEEGDQMASRSKKARRRISAFIGMLVIVAVLIAFIGVIKTVVSGFNNIGSTGEKKAEYTEFISPVVINDPEPFESIEEADNQMLLESSIWSVLDGMNQTSNHNYKYDATGKIILSADEVAAEGKKLFGPNVTLQMDVLSESDGNTIYYYDSVDNSFHISTGGIIGPSANITKIAQKSDYISLVVGYVSQADMNLTSSDEETECYKYMEYILTLNSDGSYYIKSITEYVEE